MRSLLLVGPPGWCQAMTELAGQIADVSGIHQASDPEQAAALIGDGHEWVILCAGSLVTSSALVSVLPARRCLALFACNISTLIGALEFRDALDTLQELEQTLMAQGKAGIQGIIG